MDAEEIKSTCKYIIKMYKYDPEEAHIYEDQFLCRVLITLNEQIKLLSTDVTVLNNFKQTTGECMNHINKLLKTERTKWYA